MIEPRHYTKQLTKITSVRLPPNLLADGTECADNLGISFSDFIRQSINRNINVSMGIEDEVNRQATNRALGR